MIKRIFFLAGILVSLSLSGCGFGLRNSASIPKPLHYFHFAPDRMYSISSIALQNLFDSLKLNYSAQKNNAPFSLEVSDSHFVSSQPNIVNTALPSTMSYSQKLRLSIIRNKTNTSVISQTFSASRSITLNVNQIYTDSDSLSIQQSLNREIANQVYYWLISQKVSDVLAHASKRKTT